MVSYVVRCDKNLYFSLECRILPSYFSRSWPFFQPWWLWRLSSCTVSLRPKLSSQIPVHVCVCSLQVDLLMLKCPYLSICPLMRVWCIAGAVKISITCVDFKWMHVLMQALPLIVVHNFHLLDYWKPYFKIGIILLTSGGSAEDEMW